MDGEPFEILERLLDFITGSLIDGEDVLVPGLGAWVVKH
jgi:nucleoid DNA-binding protein